MINYPYDRVETILGAFLQARGHSFVFGYMWVLVVVWYLEPGGVKVWAKKKVAYCGYLSSFA